MWTGGFSPEGFWNDVVSVKYKRRVCGLDLQIDLQTFLTLTDQDLKELGITTFGARRKMLLAISGTNGRNSVQKQIQDAACFFWVQTWRNIPRQYTHNEVQSTKSTQRFKTGNNKTLYQRSVLFPLITVHRAAYQRRRKRSVLSSRSGKTHTHRQSQRGVQ